MWVEGTCEFHKRADRKTDRHYFPSFPLPSTQSDPSRRLGRTQGGAAAIIKHQWFSGFDWDVLLDRTMKTPYAPKVGALDSLGSREDGVDSAKDSSWEPVFD